MYTSYSFSTSALEGGDWSASRPGRALPPGKEPQVPTVQEAGWAPEPVWTQRGEEKSSACRGSNPGRAIRSQALYWLSYTCWQMHILTSACCLQPDTVHVYAVNRSRRVFSTWHSSKPASCRYSELVSVFLRKCLEVAFSFNRYVFSPSPLNCEVRLIGTVLKHAATTAKKT
jgi:hypothetical protein